MKKETNYNLYVVENFIMDFHEHIKQYNYFRFLKALIFTDHLLLLFVEFYYENLCEKHEMGLRQMGHSVLYRLQVRINLCTHFTLADLKFLPHPFFLLLLISNEIHNNDHIWGKTTEIYNRNLHIKQMETFYSTSDQLLNHHHKCN